MQNVNTVNVIMPAWPILLYTNPTLGKCPLLGLLEYQTTGQYPNAWAIHDLGSSYPNAAGHNAGNDEAMPLEECGNVLIMALSYTQKSDDISLITQYVSAHRDLVPHMLAIFYRRTFLTNGPDTSSQKPSFPQIRSAQMILRRLLPTKPI